MPIIPSIETTRISQDEFKELSYQVMQHVFAIHNEFGRMFDETIYKKELAARMHDVLLEASVELVHGTFVKQLFADVVVAGSGLFEFKVASEIHGIHRAQAIQYLLLFDLAHAKVVNMRTEQVQHEFVNCRQRLPELKRFNVDCDRYNMTMDGSTAFRDELVDLLRDWGTGLSLSNYEEAMLHVLAKGEPMLRSVSVIGSRSEIGQQRMRLAAPDVAFKLTALPNKLDDFRIHAKRLVDHTSLRAIHWANIRSGQVTFETIQ